MQLSHQNISCPMDQGTRNTDLSVERGIGVRVFRLSTYLAPPKADDIDHERHTSFGDMFLRDEGLMLSLKWTKTRQAEKCTINIPLPNLGSSQICPFQAWRAYNRVLHNTDLDADTPLLLTTGEPVGKVVTVPILRALFKKAVSLADLGEFGYTPHSLRRGGATQSTGICRINLPSPHRSPTAL